MYYRVMVRLWFRVSYLIMPNYLLLLKQVHVITCNYITITKCVKIN